MRIDFLVKGDPEPVVLNPGDAALNLPDVPQSDIEPVTAFYPQMAFSHHSPVRKVSDTHPVSLILLLDTDIGQQKQAVARFAPCLYPGHGPDRLLNMAQIKCSGNEVYVKTALPTIGG